MTFKKKIIHLKGFLIHLAFRKAFIIFMNISKTSNNNELMAAKVCLQVTLNNFHSDKQHSSLIPMTPQP